MLDEHENICQTMQRLTSGLFIVGDCVDLPNGAYTNADDDIRIASVVYHGRYIGDVDIFNEYGEISE